MLGIIFTAGCSHYESKPVVLRQIEQVGVSGATLKRLENGRVLSLPDITDLVRRGVPDEAIVSYLHSTRARYSFTDSQMNALRNAGAGPVLINYLGQSSGYYEATERNETGGSGFFSHPYFTDPAYWGIPPFDWAFPAAWEEPMDFDELGEEVD